jgi:hypothetical protein
MSPFLRQTTPEGPVDRMLLYMLQGEGKVRYSVMVQWQWNVNGGGVDLSVLMSCCKL